MAPIGPRAKTKTDTNTQAKNTDKIWKEKQKPKTETEQTQQDTGSKKQEIDVFEVEVLSIWSIWSFEVWGLRFEVWGLMFDVWCLMFDVWCLMLMFLVLRFKLSRSFFGLENTQSICHKPFVFIIFFDQGAAAPCTPAFSPRPPKLPSACGLGCLESSGGWWRCHTQTNNGTYRDLGPESAKKNQQNNIYTT